MKKALFVLIFILTACGGVADEITETVTLTPSATATRFFVTETSVASSTPTQTATNTLTPTLISTPTLTNTATVTSTPTDIPADELMVGETPLLECQTRGGMTIDENGHTALLLNGQTVYALPPQAAFENIQEFASDGETIIIITDDSTASRPGHRYLYAVYNNNTDHGLGSGNYTHVWTVEYQTYLALTVIGNFTVYRTDRLNSDNMYYQESEMVDTNEKLLDVISNIECD